MVVEGESGIGKTALFKGALTDVEGPGGMIMSPYGRTTLSSCGCRAGCRQVGSVI